jgi:hypothetical protein
VGSFVCPARCRLPGVSSARQFSRSLWRIVSIRSLRQTVSAASDNDPAFLGHLQRLAICLSPFVPPPIVSNSDNYRANNSSVVGGFRPTRRISVLN